MLVPHLREDGETSAQLAVAPEPSRLQGEADAEAKDSSEVYAAQISARVEAMRDAFDAAGLTSAVSPEMRAAITAHHEALIACLPTHEMEFDAAVALEQATDEALRTTPVWSLADLRAKLTYLMPIIEPDMIDLSHAEHLRAIQGDVDRLCRTPPNLATMPTAELAALPFEPLDRASPCPVPTREEWLRDADTILPWLRLGFLLLTLDRDGLADLMLDESDDHHQGMNESLGVALRNFDQLARFAQAILNRRMIGMATLAVRVGAEG